MDLSDLYLVTRHLLPATAADIAGAEQALGTALPTGYAAFVERYGEGLTCGVGRVYPPSDLVARTAEWRDRITEYWFWESAGAGIEAELLQSAGVVVADTIDGDEICFVVGTPDRYYLLPRHEDVITAATGGFEVAVTLLLSPFADDDLPATFEPWVDRTAFDYRSETADFPSVRDALLALDLHERVHHDHNNPDYLEVYLAPAGAVIRVSGGGGATVTGSYDADAPAEIIDRLVAVLQTHGLQRLG